MVLAHADVDARVPLGTALTNEDVAWNDGFAAELLHAKALRLGIATVTRATASFFVCHGSSPSVLNFLLGVSCSCSRLIDLGARCLAGQQFLGLCNPLFAHDAATQRQVFVQLGDFLLLQ